MALPRSGCVQEIPRDSPSIVPRLECYNWAMELDPDMDEIMRACDGLMQHLSEDEGEKVVCFVYFIRQKTPRAMMT